MKLLRAVLLLAIALPTFAFAQSADQEVVSVVDSPDPVIPGQTLTYTITLRNNGPDPATNGGINVNLPLEVTYQNTVTPAGFTCFVSGNNISCINPSFAVGQVQFTMTVLVGSHLLNFPDGSFSANFYPSGTTPDPNSGNNQKSATTNYDSPQTDISVAVTDSPDPVAPNGNITYTVDVANAGPDTATNANFNVFHANGLKFISGTQPSGWSCTFPAVNGTPIFSCSRASFPTGTSQFQVVLNADPTIVGINDGSFVVSFGANGTGNDTNPGNNNENETTAYVTPDADMAVSVTDSPDPVTPDNNITYTVTVTNSGPDTATGAQLNMYNASGLQFQSATVPAGWSCGLPAVGNAFQFSCTNPSFANGGNSVFTFVAKAPQSAYGIFDQTIQTNFNVGSGLTDPNNGNNSETESTGYITPDADIAVSVTDSPDPVTPDNNITYTVTVTNSGPDAATSAALNMYNASGLQYQSATLPAGWNCTLPAVGGNFQFSCTNPSFANGGNSVFTFVAKAPLATIGNFDSTILTNFNVTSGAADPVNGNNSETESTAYDVPNADLGVTATDSPDPVAAGNNITYSGTFTNGGPDTATSVSVNINLAPQLLFVSMADPAGFSCTKPSVGTNGSIVCTMASMANGASVPFTLVAQVNPTLNSGPDGFVQQVFVISSATNDPVNPNSSISLITNYTTPDANIAVTNSDSPDPVAQGSNITYTQSMTNNGPDVASNATFIQSTPAGTTFVSFTAPGGWSCTTPSVGGSGSINCSKASMTNGENAAFTLVVNVTGTGTIVSTVTGDSDTYDPNVGNNSAQAATNVTTPTSADLSIGKTSLTTSAPIGSTFSYTITVHNNGPDAATNVVMTDTLPSSLLFRSITQPAPFSCTTPAVGATGTITCTAASLANQATRTFTLVVEVASGATGSIINSASVTSSATDNNSANSTNSAGGVTAAPAVADVSIVKSTNSSFAVTGNVITWTILVSNAGPSPATNVIVTDDLPSSVAFLDATPSQGTCNASDPLSCNLGTIASGSSATITLRATVTATSGSLTNTASVSSTEGGGDSSTTPAIPIVTAALSEVPTLSEWALIAMALALAAIAVMRK